MSSCNYKNGLALSGGGSRAIAFHYGTLEALHNLGIDKKIDVVSSISGGSVIAALWALHSKEWDYFRDKVERTLRVGFESTLIKNLKKFKVKFSNYGIDPDSLADVFDKTIFNGILLKDIPEHPLLILNCAEVNTGCNFKFSKSISGSYRHGVCDFSKIRLSQAVAYSAAFPIYFSVKKLKIGIDNFVYLSDGGSYDSLAVNPLLPDKDDKISLLTQKLETLITSDTSAPFIENRKNIDRSILDGLAASYLTLSKRNISLIYNKMYELNKSGDIPFLGTVKMDSKHPDLKMDLKKEDLDLIYSYGTDFKPVKGKVFELLKRRASESTEFIVKTYLKHLL